MDPSTRNTFFGCFPFQVVGIPSILNFWTTWLFEGMLKSFDRDRLGVSVRTRFQESVGSLGKWAQTMPKTKESTRQTRYKAATELLASGLPRQQVLAHLGISSSTLTRWSSDPRFQEMLQERQQAISSDLSLRIVPAIVKSINSLQRNLECGRPQIEVRAAAELAELALRLNEMLMLSARIEVLEARLS